MFDKLKFVALVIIAVSVIIVVLTIMMPTIKTMTDFAANDTATGTYTGYREAAAAAPIWMYGIPVVVGGVAIFVKLRSSPDRR